jgi:hypothetical protein
LKFLSATIRTLLSTNTQFNMKNSTRNLILGAILSALGTGSVLAGDADFTLVNKTGYTLREIYISPTHKEAWGRDRLGNDYLGNGRSRLFKFTDKSACMQDLKVVFDDDESEVMWEEFDLCALNKITLKYNRKTREVSADSE